MNSKKDAVLVGLCFTAMIILGSFLLLLDPSVHIRFLEAIDAVGRALEILFGAGVLLGSAAIGVKVWKMASSHTLRDGSGDKTVRAVIYKGAVVQLGSAELGLSELLKLQSDLVNQQKEHMRVIDAESKAMRTMLPLLEAYGDDDEGTVEDRPQIEASPSEDEYLSISADYQPHADEFLSARKLVVGVSGSGKSNSTATICEELGRLDVPMVLADTEDEYRSLCDKRWLPHGMLVDRSKVTPENATQFGSYILENTIQAILNLQSYEMEEAAWVMVNLIAGLNQWQEARANDVRIPVEFLLEEATTWLPQNSRESELNDTPVMPHLQSAFFNDLVRKGRKRGLGLTVICQKIAEIDKRALQCEVKLLHRQTELIDLAKYAKMGISNEETLALQNGEGFYFSSRVSKTLIQVRERYSQHGANTPGISELKKYQQSRNFDENQQANSEAWRSGFGGLVEPAENISKLFEDPRKTVGREVPERTKAAILGLYREGTKRTDIQVLLDLNGDEYWMVKAVCDEYDHKKGI